MTIAVTGPFASGKSTFVGMLKDLGAHTASADGIVHDLLRYNETAIEEIGERFGEGVVGEEGIDRKALGRIVFGDPGKLSELEGILHPLVHDETDRLMSFCCCDVFVVEIPLLFEAGRGDDFDHTVAVIVPKERQRAWASERGVDVQTLRAIEARQLPQEEKARLADVVVENDAGLDRLKEKAREFWAGIAGERATEGGVGRGQS